MDGKEDNRSQQRRFEGHSPVAPWPVPQPFLKWAGGKGKLLDQILPRLPRLIEGTFLEPFAGAGAVFFALAAAGRIRRAVISDINGELINAYRVVRNDLEKLIPALQLHRYEKEHYYEVRAVDPHTLSATDRAARFIFLNRTCFNGLYRENRAGKFNVPFGRHKNPTICNPQALKLASEALKLAELREVDFGVALAGALPGDVAYLDPPYVPLSSTAKFTEYAVKPFADAEQVRLRDAVRDLEQRRVTFLASNSSAPRVRELYTGFGLEVVHAPRALNSKASARGEIEELLISPVGSCLEVQE